CLSGDERGLDDATSASAKQYIEGGPILRKGEAVRQETAEVDTAAQKPVEDNFVRVLPATVDVFDLTTVAADDVQLGQPERGGIDDADLGGPDQDDGSPGGSPFHGVGEALAGADAIEREVVAADEGLVAETGGDAATADGSGDVVVAPCVGPASRVNPHVVGPEAAKQVGLERMAD